MANTLYSGIYLGFEGTDAACDSLQLRRELMFATDVGTSGVLRYKDSAGNIHRYYEGLNSGSGSGITASAWTPFSPTLSGWLSVSKQDCKYKIIDDTVFINVNIEGIGTNVQTKLSLPYSGQGDWVTRVGAAGDWTGSPSYTTTHYENAVFNLGSGTAIAMIQTTPTATGLGDVYGTAWNGSGWNPSGYTKWLCGSFWYQRK